MKMVIGLEENMVSHSASSSVSSSPSSSVSSSPSSSASHSVSSSVSSSRLVHLQVRFHRVHRYPVLLRVLYLQVLRCQVLHRVLHRTLYLVLLVLQFQVHLQVLYRTHLHLLPVLHRRQVQALQLPLRCQVLRQQVDDFFSPSPIGGLG